MMITHVGYLIEELQRFSANARLNPPLEVSGVSPATECCIAVEDSQHVKELNDEIDELNREITEGGAKFMELLRFKEAVEIILEAHNEQNGNGSCIDLVDKIQSKLDEMAVGA